MLLWKIYCSFILIAMRISIDHIDLAIKWVYLDKQINWWRNLRFSWQQVMNTSSISTTGFLIRGLIQFSLKLMYFTPKRRKIIVLCLRYLWICLPLNSMMFWKWDKCLVKSIKTLKNESLKQIIFLMHFSIKQFIIKWFINCKTTLDEC